MVLEGQQRTDPNPQPSIPDTISPDMIQTQWEWQTLQDHVARQYLDMSPSKLQDAAF